MEIHWIAEQKCWLFYQGHTAKIPDLVAQSVASLTADPGVMSLNQSQPGPILSWSLIMKSFYDHPPPFSNSRRGWQLQAKIMCTKYWLTDK